MERNFKFYIKLFVSTLTLSAFTFGGGYVMVAMMRKKFVEKYKWINQEEMLNLTAIAQSSPGAMAVNTSILIGYRMAGIGGSLLTILGTILPPLTIATAVSFAYNSIGDNEAVRAVLWGMQIAVGACIVDVVISMAMEIFKKKQILPVVTMICAFLSIIIFGLNVMFVILICGSIGAFVSVFEDRKSVKNEKSGGGMKQ